MVTLRRNKKRNVISENCRFARRPARSVGFRLVISRPRYFTEVFIKTRTFGTFCFHLYARTSSSVPRLPYLIRVLKTLSFPFLRPDVFFAPLTLHLFDFARASAHLFPTLCLCIRTCTYVCAWKKTRSRREFRCLYGFELLQEAGLKFIRVERAL